MPRRKSELDEASNLFRTVSDASLVKRARGRTADRHQTQQHRFSINGHFYNYKVGATWLQGIKIPGYEGGLSVVGRRGL